MYRRPIQSTTEPSGIANAIAPPRQRQAVNAVKEFTRLLNVDDLAALLAISPRQVWRLADAGKLPTPIRRALGTRTVRWREADIARWIDNGCLPWESR